MKMKFPDHPAVSMFYDELSRQFPYFSSIVPKQVEMFGASWLTLFENELLVYFRLDESRINLAVRGYGRFALDSMKLQRKFQQTREYGSKTYAEVSSEVYQNADYMFGLYLPGILLSHYLWRHHFLQHTFFLEEFLPLVTSGEGGIFCDIGVGTGFYSKEMLLRTKLNGVGIDLSPHSLSHTAQLLDAHGVVERYRSKLSDIVNMKQEPESDILLNIEVLEHLEDPQNFVCSMSQMLKKGGYGLISAAINAPNADHIYLYRHADEVAEQLSRGGFEILKSVSDYAYSPRMLDELVPVNAAFIVTRR
jgi:2-polyprenyl-3-methyl-5-hydroxy-6-metoxy-1,4-benzoquinol methylase